ncbi:hypothetical protein V9U70_28735, partial [Streptomyces pratensis]
GRGTGRAPQKAAPGPGGFGRAHREGRADPHGPVAPARRRSSAGGALLRLVQRSARGTTPTVSAAPGTQRPAASAGSGTPAPASAGPGPRAPGAPSADVQPRGVQVPSSGAARPATSTARPLAVRAAAPGGPGTPAPRSSPPGAATHPGPSASPRPAAGTAPGPRSVPVVRPHPPTTPGSGTAPVQRAALPVVPDHAGPPASGPGPGGDTSAGAPPALAVRVPPRAPVPAAPPSPAHGSEEAARAVQRAAAGAGPAGVPVRGVPVQRAPRPGGSGPSDGSGAPDPAAANRLTGADMEELARRLLDPVSRLIRADLRRGRERAGRLHDGRR